MTSRPSLYLYTETSPANTHTRTHTQTHTPINLYLFQPTQFIERNGLFKPAFPFFFSFLDAFRLRSGAIMYNRTCFGIVRPVIASVIMSMGFFYRFSASALFFIRIYLRPITCWRCASFYLISVNTQKSNFGGLGVSALAFGTQVRGFKPGRSRRIFQGQKILSAPSFVRDVKPWVPCRWFTALKDP
jgi:hypothetical protein